MISFALIILGLILLSLLVLLRPLLKTPQETTEQRQTQNIQFAKQRLSELKEQRQNNRISEEQYQELRLEIEASLAADLDLHSDLEYSAHEDATLSANADSRTSTQIIVASLCALLPLLSLGLYLLSGQPSLLSNTNSVAATQPAQNQAGLAQTPTNPEIEQMIAALESKMQEAPNDVQGWRLLASSYHQMGRFEKAQTAYLHLLSLEPGNADTLAALGEVTALAGGGVISASSLTYIDRALQIDPQQPQALWLSGLAAAQKNDNDVAVQQWTKLLPLMADSPQQQQQLREIIAEARKRSANSANSASGATPLTQTDTEIQVSPTLSIRVTIASELEKQFNPSDLVFVIAKAKDGPPAPLAVKRIQVRDLPALVKLSDSDAMMEQFRLSRFTDIEVKARVSISGQPTASTGDYESESVATSSDNTEVIDLVIGVPVEL